MKEILAAEWSLIALALLAVTYNLYSLDARKGKYVMGKTFWQFRTFFEVLNWAIFLAVLGYLGYQYTWWSMLSIFVFGATGRALSILLKGFTQIFYLVGMPVLAVFALAHLLK